MDKRAGALSRRAPRVVWIALGLTFLSFAAFALFSSRSVGSMAVDAQHAEAIALSYAQVLTALVTEDAVHADYEVHASPELRLRHQLARELMVVAILNASVSNADDAASNEILLADHAEYAAATDRLFDAIDRRDAAGALFIEEQQLVPLFASIQQRAAALAATNEGEATAAFAAMTLNQERLLVLSIAVFAVGGILLVFLWRILDGHRRAAGAAGARELAASRASEERFRSLVQNASDVIAIFSAQGEAVYVSPAAERLWRPSEGSGNLLSLIHPDDRSLAREQFAQVLIAADATVTVEVRLGRPDGSWGVFDVVATNLLDRRAVGGIVAVFHDVTERKALEGELSRRAFYDDLTGLPNRALVLDRIGQALSSWDRRPNPPALLYLDLDDFKRVNDSLGHAAGDAVLKEIGIRVKGTIRAADTAARFGGDEFVVLLDNAASIDEAKATAERIATAIRRPLTVGGRELVFNTSIGVAVADTRADDPEALIRKADLAMYRGKSTGKDRVATFDEALSRGVVDRIEMETDLRLALARGQLRVHYQPIVSLTDGVVREVEALVRWQHPERGLVPPLAFIGLAEESGLIIPIGQWVLDQSLAQLAAWGERADRIAVSVNLSARQFRHPKLAADIAEALTRHGIAPGRLKLEITESAVMDDADEAVRQLNTLRAIGVHLAIDDFGTGYSSLAYLSRLPIDTLKIDRSFVRQIGAGTPEERKLLEGIVALAHTLKLDVVAEGIETEAQHHALRSFGCGFGQGYLFARPAPADQIAALLPRARDAAA